jgi:hypothetical protein
MFGSISEFGKIAMENGFRRGNGIFKVNMTVRCHSAFRFYLPPPCGFSQSRYRAREKQQSGSQAVFSLSIKNHSEKPGCFGCCQWHCVVGIDKMPQITNDQYIVVFRTRK